MRKFTCISITLLMALVLLPITQAKPKPVKITDLKVGSKLPYEVGKSLEVDTKYYIDRDYTVVEMPKELVGIQWIMTANNDKNSQGKDFLSFKVNKPSVIWIAHDSRGEEEKGGQPPEWLEKEKYEKWMDGKDPVPIKVTDGNMGTFNLWQKAFKAGKITIGGNAEAPAAGHGSNYMVLVEEDQNAAVDPQAKLSTTWAIIKSQHQQ